MLTALKATKFLRLATFLAEEFSKDTSTRVGSLIVSKDLAVLSLGYNGMPRGCDDHAPERQARPEKYLWMEHAERNAVYNYVRPVLKGSLCFALSLPSLVCARALASVGCAGLVVLSRDVSSEHYTRIRTLFSEAGLSFSFYNPAKPLLSVEIQNLVPTPARPALFICPNTGSLLAAADDALPDSDEPVRQAIFIEARKGLNGSSAIVTLMPCMDCAKGLISIGIKEVITRNPEPAQGSDNFNQCKELLDRWKDQFELSSALFAKAGIPVRCFET